jgi:uncharacterized protein (DUF488 family)
VDLPTRPLRVQVKNKELWNEERSKETADFFTIGYSGRNIEQFISALKDVGVSCLVDVRANPVSMYKPDFSKSNLERHLAQNRIAYLHLPELGVPRDIRGKAMATGDRGEIWRWYDEHVVSEFKLHRFFNMADHPVAFMCTELDPMMCHRHRLSLFLEQSGLSSFDL